MKPHEIPSRYAIQQAERCGGTVVYGRCLFPSPTIPSLQGRYDYAWAECHGRVYDWNRRHDSPMSVERFYLDFEPIDIQRYSVVEARRLVGRSGHHGPWSKGARGRWHM